jgi:hypothetical protein
MNRRGFVGVLAGLLGALGLRGQGIDDSPLEGSGHCIGSDGHKKVLMPCPGEKLPLKEGEEYCPLGHSQKPGTMAVFYTSGEYLGVFWPTNASVNTAERVFPRVCSVCGVVYVPPEKKP